MQCHFKHAIRLAVITEQPSLQPCKHFVNTVFRMCPQEGKLWNVSLSLYH